MYTKSRGIFFLSLFIILVSGFLCVYTYKYLFSRSNINEIKKTYQLVTLPPASRTLSQGIINYKEIQGKNIDCPTMYGSLNVAKATYKDISEYYTNEFSNNHKWSTTGDIGIMYQTGNDIFVAIIFPETLEEINNYFQLDQATYDSYSNSPVNTFYLLVTYKCYFR